MESEFIKHQLSLPNDHFVTSENEESFNKLINEYKENKQLQECTVESITRRMTNLKLVINNKEYTFLDFDFLNKLLKFLGFKNVLLQYYYDNQLSLIYASYTVVSQLNNAYMLKEEIVRFPNLPPALAALNINDHIYIRKEVIDLIYKFKWSDFSKDNIVLKFLLQSKQDKISYFIKTQYFNSLGKQKDNEEKIKKSIIENVFFHETGHESTNKTFNTNFTSFCLCSKQINGGIFLDMYEVLADIILDNEGLVGTLHNIINVSKKDRNKATQLFYLYLSDTWFFDTSDTYMYDYSLFIHVIMQHCINGDKSIDFDNLYNILDCNNPTSFISKLNLLLNNSFAEIYNHFQSIYYIDDLKKVTFLQIKDKIEDLIDSKIKVFDKNTTDYKAKFWNLFFYRLNNIVFNRKKLAELIHTTEVSILSLYSIEFFNQEYSKEQLEVAMLDRYKQLGFYNE